MYHYSPLVLCSNRRAFVCCFVIFLFVCLFVCVESSTREGVTEEEMELHGNRLSRYLRQNSVASYPGS